MTVSLLNPNIWGSRWIGNADHYFCHQWHFTSELGDPLTYWSQDTIYVAIKTISICISIISSTDIIVTNHGLVLLFQVNVCVLGRTWPGWNYSSSSHPSCSSSPSPCLQGWSLWWTTVLVSPWHQSNMKSVPNPVSTVTHKSNTLVSFLLPFLIELLLLGWRDSSNCTLKSLSF